MSLVFAAITPHPPILIPAIGREHSAEIEATRLAMEQLEQDLYSAKPDLIVVISPHGELNPAAFTVNLCQEFNLNFETFGDFSTKMKFPGDMVAFTAAKESISAKSPLNIISVPELDHGCGVPLFYLARHLPQTPIVPIYFSMLDSQAHFEFGKALKDLILNSDRRIAVVASGDLSHCLSEKSPAKYNPAGKIFDEKIISLITGCDFTSLVNLDCQSTEAAAECGLRSILILAGLLSDISCKPKILSYEAPFGVGYLTAEIIL
ncbi:MAG: AmmeMemoRadiSam system protein B [Patescibacteria group bacterium]